MAEPTNAADVTGPTHEDTSLSLAEVDAFLGRCYSLAVKATAFRRQLEKARGDADYLETGWTDGRLLVKRKYKKKRDEEE